MAEKVENGVHESTKEEKYVKPTEEKVLEHLEWFKDQKLGLMMHWAPGSQLSVVESWSLASKSPWDSRETENPWMLKEINWTEDVEEYREQLRNTNKTFNPIKFQPKQWAKMAKDCGFKYLLFTTKHHDGFCMFDTKYSDYKITSPDCPFHTNKNADVVRSLYDAFRAEGLGISTYFSKPDWNSEYFWSPDFPNNNHICANYDTTEHPEIWEKFVEYTHNQLLELTSEYGKVDLLWLDGGWVLPEFNHQDIRLGEVVDKIRATTQPHLIVADRCAGGKYENVITPEQKVPAEPLEAPWESCITLGRAFSFHYNDYEDYKSPREIIHMLISVVAKGGNLALNITPQPDGELPEKALAILNELGGWLKVNGEGIYGTRPIAPYDNGGLSYTCKDGNVYVFAKYNRDFHAPRAIEPKITGKAKEVILLRTGEKVPFTQKGEYVSIDTKNIPYFDMKYADCFKIVIE